MKMKKKPELKKMIDARIAENDVLVITFCTNVVHASHETTLMDLVIAAIAACPQAKRVIFDFGTVEDFYSECFIILTTAQSRMVHRSQGRKGSFTSVCNLTGDPLEMFGHSSHRHFPYFDDLASALAAHQ